jgi:hypothetical protein
MALPGLKEIYDAYSFNIIPQIGRCGSDLLGESLSFIHSLRQPLVASLMHMSRALQKVMHCIDDSGGQACAALPCAEAAGLYCGYMSSCGFL